MKKKKLRKAYRKGRKEGFDSGFNMAKAIFATIEAELIRTIESLNSEIILGDEEYDDEEEADE